MQILNLSFLNLQEDYFSRISCDTLSDSFIFLTPLCIFKQICERPKGILCDKKGYMTALLFMTELLPPRLLVLFRMMNEFFIHVDRDLSHPIQCKFDDFLGL